MAKKKRNLFNLVKSLFTSATQEQKQDKKEKSRKWVFHGMLFKVRRKPPSIAAAAAATSSPPRERTRLIDEAGEGHSTHALDIALASAAAAEAAVAAAHIAAEVVWLTGVPSHQLNKERQVNSTLKIQVQREEVLQSAAIRIQSGFRGYLGRKALHALKGIVKLQAIIRGRNVRKQAMTTLKCLQTIVNIQSQVCAKRVQKDEEHCNWDQNNLLQDCRDRIIKMDTNSQRRWDGSILTKEEANALFLSKKEASIKRDRIKEYSFNHRNSSETERNKINGRWRYWLEQWVDTHVNKSRELEDLDTVLTSSPNPTVEYRSGKQIRMRGLQKQYRTEGTDSDSAMAFPRRSYHRKQNSLGEDNFFSGSPIVPTYMAATESAKAKARSLSSPKLRPGSFDAYSESYSPCKNKLYLISSRTSGDGPLGGRLGRPSAHQQKSPSLKNLTGPVKSALISKDLSFDSECSLRTWGQPSTFR